MFVIGNVCHLDGGNEVGNYYLFSGGLNVTSRGFTSSALDVAVKVCAFYHRPTKCASCEQLKINGITSHRKDHNI